MKLLFLFTIYSLIFFLRSTCSLETNVTAASPNITESGLIQGDLVEPESDPNGQDVNSSDDSDDHSNSTELVNTSDEDDDTKPVSTIDALTAEQSTQVPGNLEPSEFLDNSNGTEDYSDISDTESEPLPRYVPNINHTLELFTKWAKISENTIETLISEAMPHVTEFGYRFEISEDCILSLLQLLNAIRKQKAWAFQMIDSYGRPSPGFLEGTVTSLGDYDECLRIDFPKYLGEEASIIGKYCLLRIDFPVPAKPAKVKYHEPMIKLNNGSLLNETVWAHLTKYLNSAYTINGFRFGVCIPSACSAGELEPIIKKVAEPLLEMPLTLGPEDECVSRTDKVNHTVYSKVASAFFAALLFLTLLASISDYFRLSKSWDNEATKDSFIRLSIQFVLKVLSCFSLQSNTRSLMTLKQEQSSSSDTHRLRVLDGLQVSTLCGLIFGHTYFFGGFYKTASWLNRWTEDLPQNSGKIVYQGFINTHLFMESLFFISGLTLAMTILPKLKSIGGFNYLGLIFKRWLRFLPLIAAITLFTYLQPFMGSGPMFKHHVKQIVQNCEKNWWPNVIGMGNWFGKLEDMCAPQLWYLSADIQLHLLVPLIFFGYQRNEKCGLIINSIFIVIGVIASGLSTYINDLAPSFGLDHLVDYEYLQHQFNSMYFPTYLHLSSFTLGILIAFLIIKHQSEVKSSFQLSRLTESFLWFMVPVISFAAMFSSVIWNNPNESVEPDIITRSLFAGFQRLFWCLALAWITLACSLGRGGFIQKILNSSYFRPISKLSLCIYVLHNVPIDLRTYTFRYTKPWDDHFFISWALLNIVLTVALGYLFYILIESPFIRIVELIWPTANDDDDSDTQTKDGSEKRSSRFKLSGISCIPNRKNGKLEINPSIS